MPALPAVAQVLRYQWKHQVGSDVDVLCRAYFAYTGTAPTSANLSTQCGTLITNWGTHLKALASNDVILTGVLAEDLSSSTAGVGSATGSVTGTRAGSAMPAAIAAMVNFKVARRYRGGKPRIYLPYGTVTDTQTGQTWTAAFVTALNSGWASTVADVIASAPGGTTITGQVNVSYYSGFTVFNPGGGRRAKNIPTLRATPLVDQVLSASTNVVYATQRRRNRP